MRPYHRTFPNGDTAYDSGTALWPLCVVTAQGEVRSPVTLTAVQHQLIVQAMKRSYVPARH